MQYFKHVHMLALIVMLGALLSACGTTGASVASAPAVVTQIIPQTVVVTRLATVVVTATPLPATTAPPPPTPLPAAGKWNVITDTSSFDDSRRVILMLDAENSIDTAFGSQRPTLILRCQEGAAEAYVVTGTPPAVETGNLDGATVRVRFDQEAAQTLVTAKSTDSKALFFEDAGIINTMEQHERMLFGFTPFNTPPVEIHFDLRGLPNVSTPLHESCAA